MPEERTVKNVSFNPRNSEERRLLKYVEGRTFSAFVKHVLSLHMYQYGPIPELEEVIEEPKKQTNPVNPVPPVFLKRT